jgi:gamma-glutamyltranspeptidase/glutathione hydrolase
MQGMVTSPHPLASQVGAEGLRQGGNAVWMLADRDGLATSILGIGQAPQVLPELDGPLPLRGVGSMLTTACAVDSWDQALNVWGGRMNFADLIAPALAGPGAANPRHHHLGDYGHPCSAWCGRSNPSAGRGRQISLP